jgi:hypothetical protein
MTTPPGEQRIGYRDRTVWLWPAFWLSTIALRWLLGWDAAGPMILWVPCVALLETNAVLTALRARRGLTLTPTGITWHKQKMHLPWSYVVAVEQSVSRRGVRVVVRVNEPAEALDDVAPLARPEVRANLRRFGAPIALRAGWLARPAAEVVEIADRLRRACEPPGSFTSSSAWFMAPDEMRARRSARIWTGLAGAGFAVLLAGIVLTDVGRPGTGDEMAFRFVRATGPGYMDQVLDMTNDGDSAVAPTLTLLALDGTGDVLPGVTVRTAYGSDRGLVVIPPRSTVPDVLAFDGPGFRRVADVRVTVRRDERVKTPSRAAGDLPAQRMLAGRITVPLEDFDSLLVSNTNPVQVSVRMVCILWEDPPPGATQQMLASLPIGGLVSIAPHGEVRVAVTGPVRKAARGCGSVKVYYSRPGRWSATAAGIAG